MRFFILLITALLFVVQPVFAERTGSPPSGAFSGNLLVNQVISMAALTDEDGVAVPIILTGALTDASPTYTKVVPTRTLKDFLVYTLVDKGSTVKIYPMPIDNYATTAKASDTVTIADGGVTVFEPLMYSSIGTPRAKVEVTKTEAGDTSSFVVVLRGYGL